MDTSDFYETAVTALEALNKSVPAGKEDTIKLHNDAILMLRDFIRAADDERAGNNTRANYKAHLKEGDIQW